MGDNRMVIRTSALEDKATACRMLKCLVADLKEGCVRYLEPIASLMAPLATESIHDDIRTSGLAVMPDLVQSIARATPCVIGEGGVVAPRPPVQQLVHYALGILVNAVKSETEIEVQCAGLQAIQMTLENANQVPEQQGSAAGGGVVGCDAMLPQETLEEVATTMIATMQASFQRRAIRRASATCEEDYDEEEAAKLMCEEKDELDLQFQIAEVIGCLVKLHQGQFMPVFRRVILPKVTEMSHEHCLASDRKVAVFILDDLLEHACILSVKEGLFDSIMPVLLKCCESGDPPLLQASYYGLGMGAKFSGSGGMAAAAAAAGAAKGAEAAADAAAAAAAFVPYIAPCVAALQQAVAAKDQAPEEMLTCIDNAISALGLVYQHHGQAADAATWLPQWLQLLPLQVDLEESKVVMERVCEMVEQVRTEARLWFSDVQPLAGG
jgi:hypothetical protein